MSVLLPWRRVAIDGGVPILTSVTENEARRLSELAAGRDVLEIGSAYGFSTVMMAKTARHVTTIDPHVLEGSLGELRSNLKAYGVEDDVTVVVSKSQDACRELIDQGAKFGLVFIDGDHAYRTVVSDLIAATKLLDSDGILACHDYDELGCVGVTKALNEWFDVRPRDLVDTLYVRDAADVEVPARTPVEAVIKIESDGRKVVLNAGCGERAVPKNHFPDEEWRELRVDLDPRCDPDVIADIQDLPFEDESVDGVFCCNVLEHFTESEVVRLVIEFRRVLRPDGKLLVAVPDIKAAAREILSGRLIEGVYDSGSEEDHGAGWIRPLDMLYGMSRYVDHSPLMAHKTGFTAESLAHRLGSAGFDGDVMVLEKDYQLVADARKLNNGRRMSCD